MEMCRNGDSWVKQILDNPNNTTNIIKLRCQKEIPVHLIILNDMHKREIFFLIMTKYSEAC